MIEKHGKREQENDTQKKQKSSKVTNFKDKVSCITEREACFIGLIEVL